MVETYCLKIVTIQELLYVVDYRQLLLVTVYIQITLTYPQFVIKVIRRFATTRFLFHSALGKVYEHLHNTAEGLVVSSGLLFVTYEVYELKTAESRRRKW